MAKQKTTKPNQKAERREKSRLALLAISHAILSWSQLNTHSIVNS